MLEYFPDWKTTSALIYKVTSTINATTGAPEMTATLLDGVHEFVKWVDKSMQTNQSDKFVNSETGRLAIEYKKFYLTTETEIPAVPPSETPTVLSTTEEETPGINWYALINDVKYFIDGIDNVGTLEEVYIFTYHKDRT